MLATGLQRVIFDKCRAVVYVHWLPMVTARMLCMVQRSAEVVVLPFAH